MSRRPKSSIGKVVYERDERDWFKVRKYAIRRLREGWDRERLAAHLGVGKGFLSKWWRIWMENETWDSLRDRSSRPHTIYTKAWKYYDLVVETRKEHPERGPEKIKAYLGDEIDISHQTIYKILVQAKLIKPGKKVRRRWRSFSRKHSNSLWQMDFKTLQEGGPYLLTVIDDHSRFVLASKVIERETTEETINILKKAIKMFGKPRQILTDHGTQFYATQGGTSQFAEFCKNQGIRHILAGVRKPTTIGKIERWHRTIKREFLARCKNINEFKNKLGQWLEWYNCQRPHWSLNLRTPLEIYHADFIKPEDFAHPTSVHEVS